MESIVEDVEDEREKEGSPADDEGGEDSGGCDGMGVSISVQHSDGLSRFGHDQGHHCYTRNILFRQSRQYYSLLTSSGD